MTVFSSHVLMNKGIEPSTFGTYQIVFFNLYAFTKQNPSALSLFDLLSKINALLLEHRCEPKFNRMNYKHACLIITSSVKSILWI